MNEQTLFQLLERYRESLTDRQRVVLKLTSSGWSSRQVADAIGTSHTTVLDDLRRSIRIVRTLKEQEDAA